MIRRRLVLIIAAASLGVLMSQARVMPRTPGDAEPSRGNGSSLPSSPSGPVAGWGAKAQPLPRQSDRTPSSGVSYFSRLQRAFVENQGQVSGVSIFPSEAISKPEGVDGVIPRRRPSGSA